MKIRAEQGSADSIFLELEPKLSVVRTKVLNLNLNLNLGFKQRFKNFKLLLEPFNFWDKKLNLNLNLNPGFKQRFKKVEPNPNLSIFRTKS